MTSRAFFWLTLLFVAAQAQVAFKESPNKITVELEGKPFTTFITVAIGRNRFCIRCARLQD